MTLSLITFTRKKSVDMVERLLAFLSVLSCIVLISLVASEQLQADDGPALIQVAENTRLAKLLASQAHDSGMLDDVCRLYLADREGVVNALIAAQSFASLSDAIWAELNKLRPSSDCEVVIMKTSGQLSREQILSLPQIVNQPGAVFALAFFPSRLGVMVFANGYRADGRSAVFADRVDVAIEEANELDSSNHQGSGGPALPVRQQSQSDQSQAPYDAGLDEVQLEKEEKSFLDRLRERAGTERAE